MQNKDLFIFPIILRKVWLEPIWALNPSGECYWIYRLKKVGFNYSNLLSLVETLDSVLSLPSATATIHYCPGGQASILFEHAIYRLPPPESSSVVSWWLLCPFCHHAAFLEEGGNSGGKERRGESWHVKSRKREKEKREPRYGGDRTDFAGEVEEEKGRTSTRESLHPLNWDFGGPGAVSYGDSCAETSPKREVCILSDSISCCRGRGSRTEQKENKRYEAEWEAKATSSAPSFLPSFLPLLPSFFLPSVTQSAALLSQKVRFPMLPVK